MKNFIVFAVLVFITSVTHAQGRFDSLEDLDEEVSSVILTKAAFELLKKFPDAESDDMKVFNTAKGLEELKVFSTENVAIASKMEAMVNSAITKDNMTQLMRVKDNGSRVKIYIKATKNKDIVSEVLMFVKSKDQKGGNPTATIISLIGEINMNELAEIAKDYDK